MSPLAWDPPAAVVALLGVAALVAWMALAPPPRAVRGVLRGVAATLLLLALFDVGCRRDGDVRGRLLVLLDRSRSMDVSEPGGPSRAEAARRWLAGPEFSAWTAGWEVRVDSFGGTTTDVAGAVESAATEGPDAILLVSDGRAARGRAAEPVGVPLYARVPEPARIADLAVAELEVGVGERRTEARVTVAAVGGTGWRAARSVEVTLDGAVVGQARIEPPVAPGERREITIPLPGDTRGTRIVEARLSPGDAVEANDRRARVWDAGGGPRKMLVVGLAPLWEMGAFRRAMVEAVEAPVDAFWSPAEGRLRPVDGTGPAIGWSELPMDRYRVVAVFGDPARSGDGGRRWLARFGEAGGRALLWAPQGYGGTLPGMDVDVEGGSDSGTPALTEEGRAWLVRRGASPDAVPDGAGAWPPLERLPATSPDLGEEAVGLLEVDGRAVAWVAERGTRRLALLLGSGYYRWPLAGPGPSGFWDVWSGSLARWLVAAEAAERPLVRLPEGGRVAAGESRIARVIGTDRSAAWRIEREGADDVVARGEVAADGAREIRAGPLDPGAYRIVVEAEDRVARERFVVERLVPDLAWTSADTTGLGVAARASGGERFEGSPPPSLPDPAAEGGGGTTRGLASLPWAYLAAAVLLLVDWGLGARRRGAGERAGASSSR